MACKKTRQLNEIRKYARKMFILKTVFKRICKQQFTLFLFSLKMNFEISLQACTNRSFNYKQKDNKFDNEIEEEIDDNLGELEAQIEDFPEFYS